MHLAVVRFVYSVLREYGLPHTVVDLGGRNCNGSLRSLFPGSHYTAVDVEPGEGVDVVMDAADYRPPTLVDCVLCTEVLEHTPRAEEIVRNAVSMLKPAGLLLLTCAGPGRVPHGCTTVEVGDEFYRNVEPEDLGRWVGPMLAVSLDHDPNRGDLYLWAIKG